MPVFFIQGTRDKQVLVEDANILFEKANEPKYIWLVENAMHTGAYELNSTEYKKRTLGFFDSAFT